MANYGLCICHMYTFKNIFIYNIFRHVIAIYITLIFLYVGNIFYFYLYIIYNYLYSYINNLYIVNLFYIKYLIIV